MSSTVSCSSAAHRARAGHAELGQDLGDRERVRDVRLAAACGAGPRWRCSATTYARSTSRRSALGCVGLDRCGTAARGRRAAAAAGRAPAGRAAHGRGPAAPAAGRARGRRAAGRARPRPWTRVACPRPLGPPARSSPLLAVSAYQSRHRHRRAIPGAGLRQTTSRAWTSRSGEPLARPDRKPARSGRTARRPSPPARSTSSDGRRRGPAGGQHVVHDQHPGTRREGVGVDLQRRLAVLERVAPPRTSPTAACRSCAPGRSRRRGGRRPAPPRMKPRASIPDDPSTGSPALVPVDEASTTAAKPSASREQRRDVLEHHARLRPVRDVADQPVAGVSSSGLRPATAHRRFLPDGRRFVVLRRCCGAARWRPRRAVLGRCRRSSASTSARRPDLVERLVVEPVLVQVRSAAAAPRQCLVLAPRVGPPT